MAKISVTNRHFIYDAIFTVAVKQPVFTYRFKFRSQFMNVKSISVSIYLKTANSYVNVSSVGEVALRHNTAR